MQKFATVILVLGVLAGLLGLIAAFRHTTMLYVPVAESERAVHKQKQFVRAGFLFFAAASGLGLLYIKYASAIEILIGLAILLACVEAAITNLKPK